jgi:hypothetical protein
LQQTQEINMSNHNALLLAGALALSLASQTQAALFFTDTTIGAADTNYDGQDIVVIGCTLTIDGSHGFSDLLVIERGVVTCSPLDTNNDGGLSLSVSNNLIIEAGSAIDVQGLGFGSGLGLGAGGSLEATNSEYGFYFLSGGGGAYGGTGGSSVGGAPGGPAFGQPASPTYSGSGGGEGFGNGGAGGGLVTLTIGAALVVDGEINADGGDGVNLASGGGSGGGINITAPSISGTGSISARGGASEGLDGGGGGGGRIALRFTTNDFTGSVIAAGGQGAVAGGAGTVVFRSGTGLNQFLVDNAGLSGTNTPLTLPPGSSVNISGGAIAYFPATTLLSSMTISSNSWLVAGPPVQNTGHALNLTVSSNVLIEAGGGISFDGAGGLSQQGSGSVTRTNGLLFGGGGGHGGNGGGGFAAAGGESFETYSTPMAVGGLGGGGSIIEGPASSGGPGGGAVLLNVLGALTLDGSISANGGDGGGVGSGGGAGGSVWLTVGTLAGGGMIAAAGGVAGSSEGGGGGGGRVAVYTQTNQFTGQFSAHGGMGFVNGGAGTIYVTATINAGQSQLFLDNAGLLGATTPILVSQALTYLTITNSAIALASSEINTRNLLLASNSFILGSNSDLSLEVFSNAIIQTGAGIIADGISLQFSDLTGNGGGGYGGAGGRGLTGAGGPSEGSVTAEVASPGWAGGGQNQQRGGAGGGALSVNVAGSLVLDGVISANGAAGAAGTGAGGGSGGGIYLAAQRLSGSGSISASGGTGDSLIGGGGGGGRITISCTTKNYAGATAAYGGHGFMAGGAGTIYVASKSTKYPQVLVDNGGLVGTNTPISSLPSCDLTIANGAQIGVGLNFSDLNIHNLFIGSNSFFFMQPAVQEGIGLRLYLAGNGTIQSGGGIIADGAGYAAGLGPNPGSTSISNSIPTGGGGGYGGYGGNSAFGSKGGGAGMLPSQDDPALPGSGGGAGIGEQPENLGGAGGGSIFLQVENSLALNGIISANGAPGVGEGSGGGAGGGVVVMAKSFSGNGTISANGGAGQLPYGGGGGGGIIEIASSFSNLFAANVSAHGGIGATAGGAGVIVETMAEGPVPQIIIDNDGLSGTNTPAPVNVTDYDLTISGGAIMAVSGNSMLTGGPHNLLIGSNSFVTLSSSGTLSLNLTSNLTIAPTGGVVVDGKGEPSGQEIGGGKTLGQNGGGGGFGGPGGAGAGGAPGGVTYGSAQQPSSSGSAGGVAVMGDPNLSQGGGVIKLDVSGTLTINGSVSANGDAGFFPGAGGGAGGSVWLTAGTLSGQGVISANGGAGQGEVGGGGGGGRIAIYSGTNVFSGVTSATGGTGFANGQSGTIYVSTNGSFVVLPPSVALVPQVGLSTTNLNLQWAGSGGWSYQVELSRDLILWRPYGPPSTSSNGPNVLVLPIGPDSGTFFRLVLTN